MCEHPRGQFPDNRLLNRHFSELAIGDVGPETFADYVADRLAQGRLGTGEGQHRDTVREIYAVWQRLSAMPAFAALGVCAVPSPFADGRDKYMMPADLLRPLLAEFDTKVLPWARGEVTPDGRCVDAVLDQLKKCKKLAKGFIQRCDKDLNSIRR